MKNFIPIFLFLFILFCFKHLVNVFGSPTTVTHSQNHRCSTSHDISPGKEL